MLAAEIPTTQGQVVNIACQQRISLNEILAILRELLGKDIPAKYAGVRPGDVRDSLADITRAKELLGYEPRIDFEQGLRLAIDWYKENL